MSDLSPFSEPSYEVLGNAFLDDVAPEAPALNPVSPASSDKEIKPDPEDTIEIPSSEVAPNPPVMIPPPISPEIKWTGPALIELPSTSSGLRQNHGTHAKEAPGLVQSTPLRGLIRLY